MIQKIAIDPGHPPKGCSAPGLVEHEYVWQIAVLLRAWLDHLGEPFDVNMLRMSNESVSLEERGRRSAGTDLVLHLHVNWNPRSDIHGCETYYWPGNIAGREVCDAILRAAPVPLHRPGRVAISAVDTPSIQDDWIRNARAVMWPHVGTSALVEIGYASNPTDLRAMLDPSVQSGICAALLCGCVRFRQLKEKT